MIGKVNMIKKLKKEWGKIIGLGIGVLLVFFFFRLINLTILPIFADEAIYIRWSQVMKAEPTLRFLPLSDGKQPLFMWILMFALGVVKNPLFMGRLLSVFAGFGSLTGIFLLSYELFKDKKLSLFASFFYAVVPFFVFFDRMALVDSLLTTFGIWVFYFGILLIKNLRLDLAMITGMILGGALITKSPALFYALLLPTVFLFHPFSFRLKGLKKWLHLGQAAFLWGVVYVFAFGIYNLLRLGPNFQLIAQRNKDYVFTLGYLLAHPFDPLKPHLYDLAGWLPNLLTWPILLMALVGFVWLLLKKENWRQATWLLAICILPLLAQSAMAKVFTPRYILFAVWPLIIFVAAGLVFLGNLFDEKIKLPIKKEIRCTILVALLIIPSLGYNFYLLSNPEQAPLPRRMRSGYLEEWTAGQGIKEIADFVKEIAKERNVLIGTEGFFGTLPDGLQIYLEKVPRVTVIGVGYPIADVNPGLVNALVDNDVYLVVNQSRLQISPENYGLKLVGEYPKSVNPKGIQDKLLFFELDKEFWQK